MPTFGENFGLPWWPALQSGPRGDEFPDRGVHLEVIGNERLVFMDFHEGWGQCASQLEELASAL